MWPVLGTLRLSASGILGLQPASGEANGVSGQIESPKAEALVLLLVPEVGEQKKVNGIRRLRLRLDLPPASCPRNNSHGLFYGTVLSGRESVVPSSCRGDELVCQLSPLAGQTPGLVGVEKFGEVGH
jgi:hypothetical protein